MKKIIYSTSRATLKKLCEQNFLFARCDLILMFQGKGLLSDYSLSFFSFQLFICFPVNFKDDLSKYI